MKAHWQKQTGQRIDSIDISDGQVFVGTDEGFGHGCSGVATPYSEFLGGKLNDLVESIFGAEIWEKCAPHLRLPPNNSFKPTPLRGAA